MKIYKYFIVAAIALLASCSSQVSTKDIKYMSINFKPLSRTDFTIVGNLTVQSTITGQVKQGKKILDKQYSANYKTGLISKKEASEVMYYAPKEGEIITGALYEDQVFNSIFTPSAGPAQLQKGLLVSLLEKFGLSQPTAVSDPGVDFAYYEMVAKYPEVDYFVNVRFDRDVMMKGKTFTEKITVKADGVVLKTN